MQRRAAEMRAALEGQLSSGWREFEDVVAVLVAAGALAPGTLQAPDLAPFQNLLQSLTLHARPAPVLLWLGRAHRCMCSTTNGRHADGLGLPEQAQPLGEVARQVNGENELWLAMALTHAGMQVRADPPPPRLRAAWKLLRERNRSAVVRLGCCQVQLWCDTMPVSPSRCSMHDASACRSCEEQQHACD
jgi:hypothetical protein